MTRAIICLVVALGMLVYEFPILRGQRRTQPLTPDQKIWRILVVITVLLLVVLGGILLFLALKAKAAAPPSPNHF